MSLGHSDGAFEMTGKMRVHELAMELGLTSNQVMAKLTEMHQFVKSPSSTIEAPVVRVVRAQMASQSGGQKPAIRAAPPRFATLPSGGVAGIPRLGRPRREWYRGPQPAELTTMILDRIVIHRRSPFSSKPGGPSRYFADEVMSAQALAAEWADALFEGLSTEDIVEWMRLADPPISLHQALSLHSAQITPDDLDSSELTRGGPTLGFRLSYGNITIEEIMIEVNRRRGEQAAAS